jgi:glucokinase
VAAGLVGPEGQVLEHVQAPTHAGGPGRALETILDLLARLQQSARARGVTVTGVGVGVPGIVDTERGTVGVDIHHVPELAGVPLGERLARPLGLPVFVDNDVNVLALAEWMWGAGRGARSLVMLALGTGVGGGIILDGRLHRGCAGFAGELGHVPIDFDGPPCICGGRGCLKAYVSGTDIAQRGSGRLGRPVTAAEIFRLAAAGDPAAEAAVDEVCRALGAGLGIIVNGLNPERVLLAGSVAKSLRPLEARLRAGLARHSYEGARATTHLEILSLDKAATVRGGAALVHYETRDETDQRRTTTS